MDYFQGVVTEYLRANRATFVNTECYLSLRPGDAPQPGTSWYCDALAVNFRERSVYLCEVTYSTSLHALMKRLRVWAENWPALREAIGRDCAIPPDWSARPWVFIPEALQPTYSRKLGAILDLAQRQDGMPPPRLTYLEDVVPWRYRSWDRPLDSEVDVQNETSRPPSDATMKLASPAHLVLALNRGLWGEVHPQLRQASIEAEEEKHLVRVRFEYDGEPSGEVQESCACAATECIADFPSPWMLEEEHISRPVTQDLQSLKHLVYRRAEPYRQVAEEDG